MRLRISPFMVVAALMIVASCGGGDVADEVATILPTPTFVPAPPTSTPLPQLGQPDTAGTAEPEPTPNLQRGAPPTPTSTPFALPAPTATLIPAIPTAAPTARVTATSVPSTPRPAAATPRPAIPTAQPIPPTPRPVATVPPPIPTPPTTSSGIPVVQVGCTISPNRPVQVGEALVFRATQDPIGPPVRYAFDHGDGTLDPQAVSNAFYAQPGTYPVTLRWTINGTVGSIPCGSVTVVGAPPTPSTVGLAAAYLGRSERGAVELAAQHGFSMLRVSRRDRVVYPAATDVRSDRINVEVDGGIVTAARVG